jgi:tetratricopeptide (TPR) repeat protein
MTTWLVRMVKAATVLLLVSSTSLAYGAGSGTAATPGARYFDTGRSLLAEGRVQEGFRLLAVSVALAPADVARQTYFLAYLDRNAFNWDVKLHEDLVAVNPAYPPLLQRLGKLYEGKQRFGEAEALYRRWSELRPGQPEPFARLGELYYFTGRYREGLDAFSRHRELVGESDYALRRMAAIYAAMGDPINAARMAAASRAALGETGAVAMAKVNELAR